MKIQAAQSPESEDLTHPWLQANSHPNTDLSKWNPGPKSPSQLATDLLHLLDFSWSLCFLQDVQTERILFLLIQIGHNSRADGAGELSNSRTQSTTCFQKQMALLGRYNLIGLTEIKVKFREIVFLAVSKQAISSERDCKEFRGPILLFLLVLKLRCLRGGNK